MRIKEFRKAKRITQSELADMLGIGHSQISKYESGKAIPPTDKLIAIANYLDVSVAELVEDKEPSLIKENISSYEDYKVDATFKQNKEARLRAYLIALNNGHCDLCGAEAPFKDELGIPYLEISHIQSDAEKPVMQYAVLCPTCHAKVNAATNREELIKELQAKLKR